MKLVNKLAVIYHARTVGTLSMTPDNRLCAFQYDKEWLATGFSISPFELPLKPDLFVAKPEPFWGNFGIFEDSLPDGYGRYLLNRLLKKQGVNDGELTPLQRLSIVGTSGMGALCYIPETYVGEEKTLPELDNLQQIALDVLSEKSDKDEEVLYFNSGNSGGCRPKCLLQDVEGAWLVKFRHTYDPKNMGMMEFRYNEIARKCGITVPDFKLMEGKYFASKRFDVENGATQCSGGYNWEHATSVNNQGNPSLEDMLIVGESIRISRKKGLEIIRGIANSCEELLAKEYEFIRK